MIPPPSAVIAGIERGFTEVNISGVSRQTIYFLISISHLSTWLRIFTNWILLKAHGLTEEKLWDATKAILILIHLFPNKMKYITKIKLLNKLMFGGALLANARVHDCRASYTNKRQNLFVFDMTE